MKTTLDIPDELFREAKATAARNGGKLKDLVADGLRLVLGIGTPASKHVRFPLIPARPGAARLSAANVQAVEASEELAEASRYARRRRR